MGRVKRHFIGHGVAEWLPLALAVCMSVPAAAQPKPDKQDTIAAPDDTRNVLSAGAAQSDAVGQMLSVTGRIPSPASFTSTYDPFRSIIGPFTRQMEFGGNVGLGAANAIVGGIVCPDNITVGRGSYCGGVSGYAYNMAGAIGTGAVATATGVAGYGGFGVAGGFAWGLVGFASNCMGPNCPSNTGFGGSAAGRAGLTSQENDLNTYRLSDGSQPDYVHATGLLIQGTADNQARYSRAHSLVYGIQIQVLDANNYISTRCDGTGVQSHCWDADFVTSDGSSFVAMQIGALQVNTGSVTAASQNLTFFAYNAGVAQLAMEYLNPSGQFMIQSGVGGSVALALAGTPLLEVSNTHPEAGATSLKLLVNSPSGGVINAPVTMGGANSGGPGYRSLIIPN